MMDSRTWLLSLPNSRLKARTVHLTKRKVLKLLQSTGRPNFRMPDSDCSMNVRSRFGEDLTGAWLLETCGPNTRVERDVRIDIPIGGLSIHRRVDWLVDGRIIVEVKTYKSELNQGSNSVNTHQLDDFARWRDFFEVPKRAIVLARVGREGNVSIDRLFRFALAHFWIPIITFMW